MSIYEEGIEQGIAALVLDYIEEHIPKERSIQILQKRFTLTREKQKNIMNVLLMKRSFKLLRSNSSLECDAPADKSVQRYKRPSGQGNLFRWQGSGGVGEQ